MSSINPPQEILNKKSLTPLHGDHQDIRDGTQDTSSSVDLDVNQGSKPRYLSPNYKEDGRLQDPDHFRRLSVNSISSSEGFYRGHSPVPTFRPSQHRTWRAKCWDFWARNQGLFLVTVSQLFGALMSVTTRLLELEGEGMQPFQVLFARQGLTMLFCSIWMWYTKVPDFPFGAKGVRKLLVARAFSGFFGIYGMYCMYNPFKLKHSTLTAIDSLQYLPVADAVVISFLAPPVAGYGCYLFLNEPFSRSSQYASLISLFGVILIARPTSFFSTSSTTTLSTDGPANATTTNDSYTSFPESTPSQRLDAVLVALVGVFGSAGAFTSIRHIGDRAHPLLSVNYFSVFCTVISFLALTVPSPLNVSFKLPADVRQWSMLLFLGLCGFTMQFLLTKGLSAGGKKEGGRGMNMIYTNMLFAMGLDRLVFGIVPDVWSLVGGGIVLGCAIWIAMQKKEVTPEGGRSDLEDQGERRSRRQDERGNDEERRGMLRESPEEDDNNPTGLDTNSVELHRIATPRTNRDVIGL